MFELSAAECSRLLATMDIDKVGAAVVTVWLDSMGLVDFLVWTSTRWVQQLIC